MTPHGAQRFPIRFDRWFRRFSTVVLLSPEASWVDVGEHEVDVRMGYVFRARFPRSAVSVVDRRRRRILGGRGVHGLAGRWLVNGSGEGLVTLELAPPQRARVLGFPVRLRELVVSAERPEELVAALAR